MHSHRVHSVTARVRDAFRVEPLEPRVLLSADPVFTPLSVVILPEERDLQDKLRLAEQQSHGEASMASSDAMLGMLASVPSVPVGLQVSSATQALLALPNADQGSLVFEADGPAAGATVGFSLSQDSAWLTQGAPEQSFFMSSAGEQGLSATLGQATASALAPEWQLDLQSAANPQLQIPRLERVEQVERLSGQSFDLAQLAALDKVTDLWVGADAALKGSGAFYGDLNVEGLLSPGYSPGVQNVGTLTLGAGSQTLFEIGGATAGTQFDQINVSGLATLDGQLQVDLINGFRPTDGQVFNVLNYGSVSSAFASSTGLLDAGEGVFFEVVSSANSLNLKARVLDRGTADLVNALRSAVSANDQALQDKVGQWLNIGYFVNNSSFSFNGNISLGQGLSLSGAATIGFTNNAVIDGQTVDVFTLGLENASGFLGLDPSSTTQPGLKFLDADLGLLWLRSETDASKGWAWGEGTVAGLSLVGSSNVSLTATSLTIDFAQALGQNGSSQAYTSLLNLSAAARSLTVGGATYTFDSADTTERAAVSGTASLNLGSVLSLAGSLGFASSASGLIAVGSDVTARMSAGGVSVGLDSANFGLRVLTDNTYQLEASGSFYVNGGGFANVSATSALLRLNTTGSAQTQQVVQVGSISRTLSAMGATADPVLNVTGLQARIGESLQVSGNLSFERDATTGNLEVVASSASASVRVGDMRAGVTQASLALVIRDAAQSNPGMLVEASGAADMSLGESIALSATSATVRWNSTNLDASSRAINVAGTDYTFGSLGAGVKAVNVSGANLVLGDFFRVNGNFAFLADSTTVKLATDTAGTAVNEATTGIEVSLLTLGGKDLSAQLGASGGPQVALTGVEFGLALMSAKSDASRRWTSAQASATGVSLNGLSGVSLSGQSLAFSLNQAEGAGDAVVSYASGKTTMAVATGVGTNLNLSMDGAQGELLKASGNLTVDAFGFVRLTGDLNLTKSTGSVKLADLASTAGVDESVTPVVVDQLLIGGNGLSAFAGINGGSADPTGLNLTGVNFALAVQTEKTPAANTTAREWTAVKASATGANFVGVTGLTVSASAINVEITRQAADTSLVNYAAQNLAVQTGTFAAPSSITLDLGANLGEVTRASGNLTVDAFGFLRVSGALALNKNTTTVKLGDLASTANVNESTNAVTVEQLTIGGSGLTAFAGINGGSADPTGLNLTGVNFAVAIQTEKNPAANTTAREWTAVKASATGANFVGVSGLTVSATAIDIAITRKATDNTLVDYNAQNLAVQTSATATPSTMLLDLAANLGEVTRASRQPDHRRLRLLPSLWRFGAEQEHHDGQAGRSALDDRRQ